MRKPLLVLVIITGGASCSGEARDREVWMHGYCLGGDVAEETCDELYPAGAAIRAKMPDRERR